MNPIKKYPEMVSEAIRASKKINLPKFDFDKIVFFAIGGSAIVGYFIKDMLKYDCKKPIEVFIDYRIPKFVDKKTLAVLISYSGNTEEPLSQFVEALNRKCKIIGVTSGGKLEEWCTKLKLPLIKVPGGYEPRYAAPLMLIPLVAYFEKIGLGKFKKDVNECIGALKKINHSELDRIANNLNGRDIAVYGPNDFDGVVRRFKNDFNENSKLLIACNTFPEMDHNDIDGFEIPENNRNRVVLLLRDRDESFEMKNRIDITRDVIRKNVKSINEVYAVGKSRLAKIVSLIYMSGYITCKIAELNNLDPKETKLLHEMKKQMKAKVNLVERLEKKLKLPKKLLI
ncbi:MAG: bifunctional phosphoglucose/phosphomannose isomerase [Candidatus Aenigmatarchaeota archaeon]